jgi:hypothetical protein
MTINVFKDILPSILQTKEYILIEPEDIAEYNPFIVNRALSLHQDCVLYVNELNLYPTIDADMQYDFYLNTLRPMKRGFQKWLKSEVLPDLECVKKYFGYSNQKAKEALRVLSDEQIAEIKAKINTGGMNDDGDTKTS